MHLWSLQNTNCQLFKGKIWGRKNICRTLTFIEVGLYFFVNFLFKLLGLGCVLENVFMKTINYTEIVIHICKSLFYLWIMKHAFSTNIETISHHSFHRHQKADGRGIPCRCDSTYDIDSALCNVDWQWSLLNWPVLWHFGPVAKLNGGSFRN